MGVRLGAQKNGKPGNGVRKGDQVQHVCRFDDELFDRIHAKATRDGTSLSEAIRTLVEWGLQAEETP
jgi:hypothetical protein